jgi:tetratricopeptide (TPR) repeat protein
MLLLDYWPLGRMQNAEGRRQKAEASDTQHATRITPHVSRFTFRVPRTVVLPLLVEKIPFFVLAVAASIVTFVVQKHEGALAGGVNLSLVARGGNALIAYSRYLGKLFWPTHLAVYYPHPGQWPLGTVLLAAGLILGLSVLVWVPRRRYPFLLIGWLWYCGTLVPVSQVVQTGGHALADRYTYIPLIGALIIVIWAAHELTRRWRYQVLALWAAAGAASIVCLVSTRHQIGYWRDSEALFRHALEVTENNWLAHDELGAALEQKGQMEEAILEFREAVRLNPEFADLQYNLGVALGKKGQTDAAIRQFQEALRLKPDFAEAHNNLGNALRIKGQIGPAIRQFQEALRLQPGYADAHNNLRTALAMKSRIDGAIRQRQEATRQKADGPP